MIFPTTTVTRRTTCLKFEDSFDESDDYSYSCSDDKKESFENAKLDLNVGLPIWHRLVIR